MGNWTRVQIIGSCGSDDVDKICDTLADRDDYKDFGPLTLTKGICGLPHWPAEAISAVGNLAERDYGAEDVAEHLKKVAAVAPSLNIKIHVGADYEEDQCVATVTCEDGDVSVGDPEIPNVPRTDESQMTGRMFGSLFGL